MDWKALLLTTLVVAGACSFDPGRDKELEAMASERVEAEQVLAMHQFGQIVFQISSAPAFEMNNEQRTALAKEIARESLAMRKDVELVMVGFMRAEPSVKQVAYSWENNNGTLKPVEAE